MPLFAQLIKGSVIEDLRGLGIHLSKILMVGEGSDKQGSPSKGERESMGGRTGTIMDSFKSILPISGPVPRLSSAPLSSAPDGYSSNNNSSSTGLADVSKSFRKTITASSETSVRKSIPTPTLIPTPKERTLDLTAADAFGECSTSSGNLQRGERALQNHHVPEKSFDRAQSETSLSRDPTCAPELLYDPVDFMPRASQMDLEVLMQFPEQVRAEVIGAMRDTAKKEGNKATTDTAISSVSSSSSSSSSSSFSSSSSSSSTVSSSSSSSSSSFSSATCEEFIETEAASSPTTNKTHKTKKISVSSHHTSSHPLVTITSLPAPEGTLADATCQVITVPDKRRRKIIGCSCKGKDCRHHKDYTGQMKSTHTVTSLHSIPQPERICHNGYIDMTEEPTEEGEGEGRGDGLGGGEGDYLSNPQGDGSIPPGNPLLKIDRSTLQKRKRFQEDFLRNIPEVMRNEVLAQMLVEEDASAPRGDEYEKHKEQCQRQDMSQDVDESIYVDRKQLRSIAVKKKGNNNRKEDRKQQQQVGF